MRVIIVTDYAQLKKLPGGRAVDVGPVLQALVRANAEAGLEYSPICVNTDMQVLQGQHRLAIAVSMKLPVAVVILETPDDYLRVGLDPPAQPKKAE